VALASKFGTSGWSRQRIWTSRPSVIWSWRLARGLGYRSTARVAVAWWSDRSRRSNVHGVRH